MTIITMFHRYH